MRIKFGGYSFTFKNFLEFSSIYKDIFILREYNISLKNKKPFIIDCGSHIGLSITYFKKRYPRSKILGFEANPTTFALLSENMKQNKFQSVNIVNFAVGRKKGKIPFYVSSGKMKSWAWGDAGVKNAWYSKENYKKIMVSSVRLSSYITEKVDLLKIDVEGMELMVISEIKKKLSFVENIIMEFHGSKVNQKNSLKKLLDILDNYKFSYKIYHPRTLFKPFRKELKIEDIDIRATNFLIIYAQKIKSPLNS